MTRDHDKNKKKTFGFAAVWRNMTVLDLAKATNKSLSMNYYCLNAIQYLMLLTFTDDLQEVMLYVPDVNDIRPKARLNDQKIIKEIVTKCGLKVNYVAPPKDEEEVEMDVCEIIKLTQAELAFI